jgi:hypothetical protein
LPGRRKVCCRPEICAGASRDFAQTVGLPLLALRVIRAVRTSARRRAQANS